MEREPYQKIADEISEMPEPKYYRLKMDIISKINTGEWTDHTKLPSENELCKQYGISRITVRKTFDELAASKYIYKVQGKGTYVSPKSQREVVLTKQSYGCEDQLRALGYAPSHSIHFLGFVRCPALIAQSLELREGELVLEYVRIYNGDGKPVIFARSYINQRHISGIERADFEGRSLSKILSQDFGLITSNQRCALEAVTAGEEIGSALGVDPGFPLLFRNSIISATDETGMFPLEVSLVYYRTDVAPFITEG